MKILFLNLLLFFASSLMAQSLRDSLFGGKLKADTVKRIVSKNAADDLLQNDTAGLTRPDSLNKLYYEKKKEWKRFVEYYTAPIITEAGSNRKVKNGEYLININAQIELNGSVTTTNITCEPQNEYLLSQIREMMKKAPVLAPPVYSDRKPRVAPLKQSITIVKN